MTFVWRSGPLWAHPRNPACVCSAELAMISWDPSSSSRSCLMLGSPPDGDDFRPRECQAGG